MSAVYKDRIYIRIGYSRFVVIVRSRTHATDFSFIGYSIDLQIYSFY
jgi:hypothetical protein